VVSGLQCFDILNLEQMPVAADIRLLRLPAEGKKFIVIRIVTTRSGSGERKRRRHYELHIQAWFKSIADVPR